jgi:uncharacterized protein (DUF58 family)
VRAPWSPTPRLAAAVAIGACCFALAPFWRGFEAAGALWWLGVLAGLLTDVWALRQARQVTVERVLTPVLSLGAVNPVLVVVRNLTRLTYPGEVRDEPPLEFTVDGVQQAFRFAPGTETRLTYHVTPPRRGEFAFGAINLRLAGGLGLLRRQMRVPAPASVKVYPRLTDIQAHELALRRERFQDIGVHMARLKGAGLEFESLRGYLSGDEPRRIDWKATARHGKLFTREYEVERSQHIVLCLDLGRTMVSRLGLLSKADHAVNAAALLAYVAASLGDWVGLYSFAGEPINYLPPRKHQFSLILDSLYALEPQPRESDYSRALLEAAHRLRKRALVVLFTDLPDPDSSARLISAVRLLTGRHVVLCAALSDYELYDVAGHTPEAPREMYERTVATTLLADRARALRALRATGALALDATPSNLSIEVLNRYLKIKAESAL